MVDPSQLAVHLQTQVGHHLQVQGLLLGVSVELEQDVLRAALGGCLVVEITQPFQLLQ